MKIRDAREKRLSSANNRGLKTSLRRASSLTRPCLALSAVHIDVYFKGSLWVPPLEPR